MIGKIILLILFCSGMQGMHLTRMNGAVVSDDDLESMEPPQFINGSYNVSLNEQLAVRFTTRENKHIWLYSQMIILPSPGFHVGLASRSPIGENHKNFAIDFKSMAIRKFKDQNAGK